MIRLGIDAFHWTDRFSDDTLWVVERARSLGFHSLEIAVRSPGEFPAEQVRLEAEKAGIEIFFKTALSESTDVTSEDEAVREEGIRFLKSLVDVAKRAHVRTICGVLYGPWGKKHSAPVTQEEWDRSVAAMQTVAEYAGDIVLALEIVNRYESNMLNTVADGVAYCSAVGRENVKLHIDTYHMNIEEASFSEAVAAAGDHLGYVHLSESNRGLVGRGTVPWAEFAHALKERGFQGPVVFESFDPSLRVAKFCHVWKAYASTGEELAVKNLQAFQSVWNRA